MNPVMGLCSSLLSTIHKNLPSNGLLYAQPQIILLYSHEHEANHAARECVGSHFNKLSSALARLVHFYRTEISIVHVS
jgi:hypothetical protein